MLDMRKIGNYSEHWCFYKDATMKNYAERAALYIPEDRLRSILEGHALPDRASGSVLFADISGFTPLAESLVQIHGLSRGAEELSQHLNAIYACLISEVERFSGNVIGFAGDAITCWFDALEAGSAENAALRAARCACSMQQAMARTVSSAEGSADTIPLSIKVAMASGPVRRFALGNPEVQLVDTLIGTTISRMSSGEQLAEKGEIVADDASLALLGTAVQTGQRRRAYSGDGFTVIDAIADGVEFPKIEKLNASADPSRLRQWILPAVNDRLEAGLGEFLTELRPAVAVFLRFDGMDIKAADSWSVLDAYVRSVQAIAARYEGNLLSLTIGDKGNYLFVCFGAPTAHEDDARRAARAALELRELSSGTARIGIAMGTMRTGSYGGPTRHAYSALGDDVNLAARLMQEAEPGEILVSMRVSRSLGSSFLTGAKNPVQVKGKKQAVSIARLMEFNPESSRSTFFRSPMVGRETELARLFDWASPMKRNGFAGTACVYGEAGLGKSRLLGEFRERLEASGFLWLECQCDQVLRQSLNPFKYMMRRYFGQSADVPAEQNRSRFDVILNELIATQAATDGDELERLRSILAFLVDLRWEDSLYERLDPKLRFENTGQAVKALLLAECKVRPTMLVVEDAHWLDDDSRKLLATVSRNVGALPFGILLAGRFKDDGGRLGLKLDADIVQEEIDLQPLGTSHMADFASRIFDKPIDKAMASLIAEKAGGNPFFAEQLLLDLRERVTASFGDLPSSLNAILVARLDRLTAGVKAVVQTASVLGREFEVQVLSRILREDDSLSEKMRQAESVAVWSALSEIRYLFKHALLRDAAYDMQLLARRRDLHALALESFETLYAKTLGSHYAALAYHAEGSADKGRQIKYYRLAADAAQEGFRNGEALDYYGRLLPLLEAGLEKAEASMECGQVYKHVGKLESAEECFRSALGTASAIEGSDGAKKMVPQCQEAIGQIYRARGEHAVAMEFLQAAGMGWSALQDKLAESRIKGIIGLIQIQKGELTEARENLQEGLRIAVELKDKRRHAMSLCDLGTLSQAMNDVPASIAFFTESLELNRELGDIMNTAGLLNNLGNMALQKGELLKARDLYKESLGLSRKIGDKRTICMSLGSSGYVSVQLGEYGAANEELEEGLEQSRDLGDKTNIAWCLFSLGDLSFNQGNYVAARSYFAECLAANRGVDRYNEASGLISLGFADYCLSDFATARAHALESLTIIATLENPEEMANCIGLVSMILVGEGKESRGAILMGIVSGLHGSGGTPMQEKPQALYDKALADAQAKLGAESFLRLFSEGKEMQPPKIMEFALGS